MLLFTRLTRTDTEFTRDDDIIAVDTTVSQATIAIPHIFGPGSFKPINPIIKNLRGANNVVVTTNSDDVLIEGQRSVTVEPGFTLWLAPYQEGETTKYQVIMKVAFHNE